MRGMVRIWLATLALPFAAATLAASKTDALAGHYYLDGVMETGSELLLQPDGHFQWYLSYGAADEEAASIWSSDGRLVTLTPNPPAPFQKLMLEITPDGGLHLPGDGHGVYRRSPNGS